MSKFPPEFASEWHYERHLEDLAREEQGYRNRLQDLEDLGEKDSPAYADAESGLKAARAQLRHYGKGHETAEKRPTQAREKRTKETK